MGELGLETGDLHSASQAGAGGIKFSSLSSVFFFFLTRNQFATALNIYQTPPWGFISPWPPQVLLDSFSCASLGTYCCRTAAAGLVWRGWLCPWGSCCHASWSAPHLNPNSRHISSSWRFFRASSQKDHCLLQHSREGAGAVLCSCLLATSAT